MGDLEDAVRLVLREHADPSIAPGQQAYMKSAMPFLGVRVPEVRRLTKAAARAFPQADLDALERAARELWDHVDEIAQRVGDTLSAHPAEAEPVVRRWIASDDLWLRRLSILCQLGRKEDTDLALLTDAIDAAADSREFFLRKAIGWALRQHARVDPEWVRAFVADRDLSPLSAREALRHLQ